MSSLCLPPVLTSPRDDAMQLYRAFKGFGCDTAKVVNILAHRDSTQRAFIEHEYRLLYSQDLYKRLSSELRGDVKKAVLSWMPDPGTKDANILRQTLVGDAIDLRAATEVICSRTTVQIQQLKQIYLARFHAYLEHDIQRQTSGDHRKLLLACVTGMRYEGPVDPRVAEQDAKTLYKAGERRLGTDEDAFIFIFTTRSREHLVAVGHTYRKMYGSSLEKVIKSETSGNFRFGLLSIIRCAENPGMYFAKVLRRAMKRLGTDDSSLIRVIVTRAEIDMQYIKAEYQKKYGKALNDAVRSETSGHYRAFLLALLGTPPK